MGKGDKATQWMVDIANDDSHGYDQVDRMGVKSDYDCSGLNICGWEYAGVSVKKYGASYTGNIKAAYLKAGFVDVYKKVNVVTGAGLKPNDVLLHEGHHVAQVVSINPIKIVHASINEKGGIKGGKPGDQTGKEICVRTYYNHPWNSVLRYEENEEPQKPTSNNEVVKACYPKYCGSSSRIDEVFSDIGVSSDYRGSAKKRIPVAEANGITGYTGTSAQNLKLVGLAKTGNLIKVDGTTDGCYPKFTGTSVKVDEVFKAIGVSDKYIGSVSKRKPVAEANGIFTYTGTAAQNNSLVKMAKEGRLIKVK